MASAKPSECPLKRALASVVGCKQDLLQLEERLWQELSLLEQLLVLAAQYMIVLVLLCVNALCKKLEQGNHQQEETEKVSP